MSPRRRWTRWRASRRRTPSRSARSRSAGRLAKSSSSRPRSERNASSFPLCGVAVTSTRWRSGSAVRRRRRSWRCWRPRPALPPPAGERAAVRLVHDHELRTLEGEVLGAAGRLDEVGGDHRAGMPLEDRDPEGQIAFEALDGARQHELRFEVELLRQLPLPLLRQVRRAEHRDPADLAAIEQLARDEARLDGLADAHVVGDEQAHRVEPEGHHQRHELVGPGLDGDAAEAAERAGGGAGRETRRVAQPPARGEVPEVFPAGQPERRRFDRLHRRQQAGDLLVEPADGTEHQQFVRGFGQDHPFPAPRLDEGARLGEGGGAHAVEGVRCSRILTAGRCTGHVFSPFRGRLSPPVRLRIRARRRSGECVRPATIAASPSPDREPPVRSRDEWRRVS